MRLSSNKTKRVQYVFKCIFYDIWSIPLTGWTLKTTNCRLNETERLLLIILFLLKKIESTTRSIQLKSSLIMKYCQSYTSLQSTNLSFATACTPKCTPSSRACMKFVLLYFSFNCIALMEWAKLPTQRDINTVIDTFLKDFSKQTF